LERKLYLYLAITLTIVITVGSLISLNKVVKLPAFNFFDKVIHVSAYFLLSISWFLAFNTRDKYFKNSIYIAILSFIYGIIIEALQGVITTYRQADVFDMIANLTGIVIAWVFFNLFFWNKYRMK
jgi:VanZ family protein